MRRLILALISGLLLLAAGCANNDEITLEATFDDIGELVPRHQVMTADVPIGRVTDIELTDGYRAHVTMKVREDTGLPSDVRAVVKRTQVLGEYYVDLIPVSDNGRLESGVITETRIADELEELVAHGTEMLTYLAADQISAAVHASATIYGGRGETFGNLLSNIEIFVSRYRAGQDDVVRLIDGLDVLTAGIAPHTDDLQLTLDTLARNSAALRDEHQRLLDALENVERMANVGARIMREHREETEDFWRVFPRFLKQIVRVEGALARFIQQWPHHNLHVSNAIVGEHVQLFADLIVCHTEQEGPDEPYDPTRDCTPENPGDFGQEHEDAPELDECDAYHRGERCEAEDGTMPRTTREGEMWEHDGQGSQ
jgi:virulence factor Mce-like protein